MIEIIVAVITGIATVTAVVLTNRKANALIAYRLEQLEIKVDRYNSVKDRTYKLEEAVTLLEEKLKVVNHRINDLEKEEKG